MEQQCGSNFRRSNFFSSERRSSYLRRFQLLRYRDVTRLRDVMETVVPIHGSGNFPTLEIRPSVLVQLVKERLEMLGVKVRDIRLNGSAATHVLSDDVDHKYKDLDLIFAIDFPKSNNDRTFERNNDELCQDVSELSDSCMRREDPTISEHPQTRPTSLPCGGRSRRTTRDFTEKEELCNDLSTLDDSGYTSSESSVISAPVSPSHTSAPPLPGKCKKRNVRPRTRSLESVSSTSSAISSSRAGYDDSVTSARSAVFPHHRCWQEIKDATMEILLEFLPDGVNRSKINSLVLGGAYVQKMVKVTNDTDKWSLISLNNNTGRNLELKFVQSMKRQFEFSVDSFQIILDTYLSFRKAAFDSEEKLAMIENFHPTVVAESVYGDFAAALRHLRQRRICTHKPEEIRGGGLLRYCNLLVRDFKPGDPEADADSTNSTVAKSQTVAKLEQHMCSRFFIDFNDIGRQRRKLVGYLNSHFTGEEDLKFEYLLVLRRVVDASTICLMQHERTMILHLITMLVRQTLANNVAKNSAEAAIMQQRIHQDFCNQTRQQCGDGLVGQCFYPHVVAVSNDSSSLVSNFSYPDTSWAQNISGQRFRSPAAGGLYFGPDQCNQPLQPQFMNIHHSKANPWCSCSCSYFCGDRQTSPYSTNPYGMTYYFPVIGPTPDAHAPPNSFPSPCMQPIYYTPGNMTCYYHPAQPKQEQPSDV